MPFKFESLQIWQKAFDLSDEIYKVATTFSKIEMFGLASQIKRAAVTVVLKICVGSTGLSNNEFGRFLNISSRSAIETVGCVIIARRRKYLTEEQYIKLYNEYDHLCRMITKFRDSLH